MYVIVEFPDEGAVQLIPQKWLFKDQQHCHWPPSPPGNRIQNQTKPGRDWIKCRVRVLSKTPIADYSQARIQEAKATCTSAIDTTDTDDKLSKSRKTRVRKQRQNPVPTLVEVRHDSSNDGSSENSHASSQINLSDYEPLGDYPEKLESLPATGNPPETLENLHTTRNLAETLGNRHDTGNLPETLENLDESLGHLPGRLENITAQDYIQRQNIWGFIEQTTGPEDFILPNNVTTAHRQQTFAALPLKEDAHYNYSGAQSNVPFQNNGTIIPPTYEPNLVTCQPCCSRQDAFEKRVLMLLTEIKTDIKEVLMINKRSVVTEFQSKASEIPFEFPINDSSQLTELESWIATPENYSSLVIFCSAFGGKNLGKVVRIILKRIIGNSLAKQVNFIGANEKICFRELKLCSVLIDSTRNNEGCVHAPEVDIHVAIQNWFRNARDLGGGKKSRSVRNRDAVVPE
ncbi:unnamed protein product [Orchesella dallaii]|uniref:DUF4806 domain-containing protein n=1 Tax=Orchesella dallaii TaxID=48710 RepID=A0ABP1S746_9HEXA